MIQYFYQIFLEPEILDKIQIFEPEQDLIQELGGLLCFNLIEMFH